MSLDIDKALKARWTAKGLNALIPSGIHFRLPERAVMPYVIYSHVSDLPFTNTFSSRYNRKIFQLDVYDTTPDLVGYWAGLIRDAFVNANEAMTSPLAISASAGVILRIEPESNPITFQESDEVCRSMQTFAIVWGESRNLVPI